MNRVLSGIGMSSQTDSGDNSFSRKSRTSMPKNCCRRTSSISCVCRISLEHWSIYALGVGKLQISYRRLTEWYLIYPHCPSRSTMPALSSQSRHMTKARQYSLQTAMHSSISRSSPSGTFNTEDFATTAFRASTTKQKRTSCCIGEYRTAQTRTSMHTCRNVGTQSTAPSISTRNGARHRNKLSRR